MAGFKRHRRSGAAVATFTVFEADLLRSLAGQLIELLRNEAATGASEVDPFELPDWLGTDEVVWTSPAPIRHRHRVPGTLSDGEASYPCDLLAVDEAYPEPVVGEDWRKQAHRAWSHDQVLLLRLGERLTVAVPGTCFTADGALEVIGRLARAVGARPERFTVALRA